MRLEAQTRQIEPAPATDDITIAGLPPEGIDLDERLQSIERKYLENALNLAKGNESQAARLLNLNHHTFRYRRKKLLSS